MYADKFTSSMDAVNDQSGIPSQKNHTRLPAIFWSINILVFLKT